MLVDATFCKSGSNQRPSLAGCLQRISLGTVRFAGKVDVSSWLSWLCFLVALGVALAVDRQAVLDANTGRTGGALAIVAGAVAVFIMAVLYLQRAMKCSVLSTSFGDPTELTTTGAFRYSRNPIYAAFLLPIGSLAIISPVAACFGVVLYVRAMTAFVIAREEAVLEAKFGEAYRDYKARVPRWFASI